MPTYLTSTIIGWILGSFITSLAKSRPEVLDKKVKELNLQNPLFNYILLNVRNTPFSNKSLVKHSLSKIQKY